MKSKKQRYTYGFIVLVTILNAWYFGSRKPGFVVANGAQVVNVYPDTVNPAYCVLSYSYTVKGVAYEDTCMLSIRSMRPLQAYLIGHTFPFAYTAGKPQKSFLLMRL